MSDARQAFHDLQAMSGEGFESTRLAREPESLERRVSVRRHTRTAVMSLAGIAVIAAAAAGVNLAQPPDPAPATPRALTTTPPPAPSPEPSPEVDVSPPVGCAPAQAVSGKAVGNLGGLEGWFNGTPTAPCEEWEQQILDHPDTVLIYTGDNTMVEAYYRTDISALGVYADLGPDFEVPDPDPDWPEDQLVLIDARTGEVLFSQDVPEIPDTLGSGVSVSPQLLADSAALAERFTDFTADRMVIGGYQLESANAGAESDSDLAEPLLFVNEDGDPERVTVRLVSSDGTIDAPGDAFVLDMGVIAEGSVLFENADQTAVQLSLPIGEDAALLVAGTRLASNSSIVVPFTRAFLAEWQ